MNLDELRAEIDKIDDSIALLYSQRMEVVEQVAEYKRKNAVAVTHSDRESAILARVTENGKRKYAPQLRALFEKIMEISREYQKNTVGRD